jgi:pectate lyase
MDGPFSHSSSTLISRRWWLTASLIVLTMACCVALSCPEGTPAQGAAAPQGLLAVANDVDGDGLDDTWEIASGLDPTTNDGNLDPDNDGIPNSEEFQLVTNPLAPNSRIRAFPTAEGFGGHAFGGRGPAGGASPKIIAVTTLMDKVTDPKTGQLVPAPGSLRAAVEATGPRIVVFKVAGTILLNTPLYIKNPYITIAGQTAPAGGIALGHWGVWLRTHDVVLRHLRVRIFFDPDLDWMQGTNMDGIAMAMNDSEVPNPNLDSIFNVMVDHCSISWAADENFSTAGWARDYTVQWSIIAEGAKYGQEIGLESLGWLTDWTPGASAHPERFAHVTIHHNLLMHNAGRNPTIAGGETYDIRNNTVYNWYNAFPSQYRYAPNVNFVGNYYMAGIDTNPAPVLQNVIDVADPLNNAKIPKFYISENFGPQRTSPGQDPWDIGVAYYRLEDGTVCGQPVGTACIRYVVNTGEKVLYTLNSPAPAPPIQEQGAYAARELVLAKAGATIPHRDSVDERLVQEVRYVRDNFTSKSITTDASVAADLNIRHFGANDGPVLRVIIFKPTNMSSYSCLPRTYRVRPGQTVLQAKQEMLARMTCSFPDGLSLPGSIAQILANPAVYQWEVQEMHVPDAALLNTLYPPTPNPQLPADTDGDLIPNANEAVIGTNPSVPDSGGDVDGDGYLNIEEYINSVAGDQ